MNEARTDRITRFLACDKGAAASEFVLVLPLLLILLFGFYEVGRLFWNYHIVTTSARDAARYAARLELTCPDTLGGEPLDRIRRLARTGTVAEGGAPLIPGWTSDSTVSVVVTCVDNTDDTYLGRYEGMAEIPTVRVTAAAPYAALFGGLFPGLTLTSVSTSNAQVWTQ